MDWFWLFSAPRSVYRRIVLGEYLLAFRIHYLKKGVRYQVSVLSLEPLKGDLLSEKDGDILNRKDVLSAIG
jgi:hypothetical protein